MTPNHSAKSAVTKKYYRPSTIERAGAITPAALGTLSVLVSLLGTESLHHYLEVLPGILPALVLISAVGIRAASMGQKDILALWLWLVASVSLVWFACWSIVTTWKVAERRVELHDVLVLSELYRAGVCFLAVAVGYSGLEIADLKRWPTNGATVALEVSFLLVLGSVGELAQELAHVLLQHGPSDRWGLVLLDFSLRAGHDVLCLSAAAAVFLGLARSLRK